MSRLLGVLLVASFVVLSVGGCATTSTPPQTRTLVVEAEPTSALEAGVAMLTARGFVIRRADVDLGDVEAVLAARPTLEVRYRIEATEQGTRITLSGQRGGQSVPPYVFDTLLIDVQERLGELP
ncbi:MULTISPECIES: hypothetical protein [Chromohalobacter]|uniref:Uncharacterized protein n=1 Tax=Chromohalobacter beijerinckii TaxID=86179 RepID=A0ABV8XFA3_9GAMM|nr:MULTISPECIES: hypothetical protein [Chromohalobacter]MCK0752420.1 hypothetical protein [Chromohalobacter japonicus]MCK0765590.1 hypothetical protein [Chromohalobacter beijerinckii]